MLRRLRFFYLVYLVYDKRRGCPKSIFEHKFDYVDFQFANFANYSKIILFDYKHFTKLSHYNERKYG
jgi:hypothetical protein